MHIKTTIKYHLTLVRIAIINKSTNNKGWQRRNGSPFALLVGLKIGATTLESSMEILLKIRKGSAF